MKKVCRTCLYGIDTEAGQSSINVRCALDDGWRLDRNEGCVEWKETTGGLSRKDRIDLANRQASRKSQLKGEPLA